MSHAIRPRRSMLYVSADNPPHLEKARALHADSLVFDLYESVAPERKAQARDNLVATLRVGGFRGQELVGRVNPLDSLWGAEDLAAVARLELDALLFPGVESGAQLRAAVEQLDQAGGGRLPVMAMIETPLAVLHAEEIAAASERLCCLVMNTATLASALHINGSPDRIGLLASLGLVVLAARAHHRAVVDGAHLDLKEAQTCEFSCRQARELGFDGKTVIHPVQLPYTNDAFTPRPKELDKARAVIQAMKAAQEAGKPYGVLDGRLLQPVELESARGMLALYEAISTREAAFH